MAPIDCWFAPAVRRRFVAPFAATVVVLAGAGAVVLGDRPIASAPHPPHLEAPDAPPPPTRAAPRGATGGARGGSPPREVIFGDYISVQVNVDAAGMNIPADAANEPSIAVDPRDPSRMVVGWRQFNTVSSNFRQAGWAWSDDAGRTWTFPGVLEENVFRSDPVVAADADGTFYYYSLTQGFTCQMFKSFDGGRTWLTPVQAFGGDKQWFAIDRTSGPGRGNLYAAWQTGANPFAPATFTRSADGGRSFDGPFLLNATANYGTLAVGPDGNVWVFGSNGGSGFTAVSSSNAQLPGVWPTFTSRSVNLNGALVFSSAPNPDGLLGQPQILISHAPAFLNQVYVLASVDPSGTDPLDIVFARSTNGGSTFSSPVVINDDPPGAVQWFGTMSVAPNGRIDVVWIDARENVSQPYTGRLYYSFSTNGGTSWSANEPLTPLFDSSLGWPQQNKMGDYFDMQSDNTGANLIYAATFNGEQDVYFLRIGPRDCNANGVPDPNDIAGGGSFDCNANQVPDECEPGGVLDCNANGVPDLCDIDAGLAADCNRNETPDSCDIASGASIDCNVNGVPDECEPGGASDCNANGVVDLCEVFAGAPDCDGNGTPDACEPDCNGNGQPDPCEVLAGLAADCNGNGLPDACDYQTVIYAFALDADPGWQRDADWAFGQPTGGGTSTRRDPTSGFTGPNVFGYNLNGSYAPSINTPRRLTTGPLNLLYRHGASLRFARWLGVQNGPGDRAAIQISTDDGATWHSVYDNYTTVNESAWSLQTYDIAAIADNQPRVRVRWTLGPTNATQQYQGWNIDDIQIVAQPNSEDCNANQVPDECDIASGQAPDCNNNGRPDACDIPLIDSDCNLNGVPDDCDIAAGAGDCDGDGILDSCEIAAGAADCDANGVPDGCQLASGAARDCNNNGVLDSCDIASGAEADCNANGAPDACDLTALVSVDCNDNNAPDECDIASGFSVDCNGNGEPDDCDIGVGVVVASSPVFAPLGFGFDHDVLIDPAPDAAGPVRFELTALGDVNAQDEFIDIVVNGVSLGQAYTEGGFVECAPDQRDVVIVSAAAFNAAKAGAAALVRLAPSPLVAAAPPGCPGQTAVSVQVVYDRVATSADLNGNGVPDECDGPALCRGDSDCDGDVDFGDIDFFVAALGGEATWVALHQAQFGAPPACSFENCNIDGVDGVNFADIDPFVALIGAACP